MRADLSYLAGFFDGEGSIGYHVAGRRAIRVQVTNSNRAVLDLFRERFGGIIYERHKGRPHHSRTWNYQIVGQAANEMLRELRPFLNVKGDRVDEVLRAAPSLVRGEA